MIGVDGARYQSLEFCGEGISELEMSDRFTICNMAIEAGAKNGIFPVDEKTLAFLKGRVTREFAAVTADADAVYDREITIELDKLVPVVAYPHLPENVHPVSESTGIVIDQAVIGSCTNGRLEDLAQAAEVLKGKKVHPHVRCIINRNFRGRMGHVDSEVYLASPYVAAASAVMGRIASPEEVIK